MQKFIRILKKIFFLPPFPTVVVAVFGYALIITIIGCYFSDIHFKTEISLYSELFINILYIAIYLSVQTKCKHFFNIHSVRKRREVLQIFVTQFSGCIKPKIKKLLQKLQSFLYIKASNASG